MRINANIYGICVGLLLGMVATASATTLVTFQVDMSQAIATAAFDPNTQSVAARGSFNGWGNSPDIPFALTNNPSGPNPALYTGTTNLPLNGVVMSYKYTIEPTGTYEGVRSGGGHNRLITLPTASGNLTLPLVYFGDAPPADVTVPVTFRLDMAQQINTGAFNTNTASVYARGFFNGWASDSLSLMTNDPAILRTNQNGLVTSNVYVLVFDVTGSPGQTIDFKHFFAPPGDNWESPAPGSGDPADNNNRFFNLSGGPAQLLPILFFSDSPYSPVATNAVTFQVDMTGKILNQEFDPAAGTVEVRGDFNGWGDINAGGTQILCTNDPTALNTNVYRAVVSITDGVGASRQYKFWSSITANGGWETLANNRVLQLVSGTTQTLPLVYFDNVTPNAGTLTIAVIGSDIQLDWAGHPGVRIQSNTSVSGGTWVDDLATDGLSSVIYPLGTTPKYYRLRYPVTP
jgi:hypothetical protein